MPDSYGNYHAKLRNSAVEYRKMGWSVIPIRGDNDSQNPKAAAVSWAQFKQRQPTVTEIASWFDDQGFGGLGIVCGPVSGLIVLDFDDADCAAAFARTCPELTRTYTVTSGQRGLPHYYYQLDSDLPMATRHTPGADLQAAGAYVVAPPTCIAGHTWNTSYGSAPLILTAADCERIRVFLDAYHYTGPASQPIGFEQSVTGTPDDLVRQYQYLAHQLGRNNALFRVSSMARDAGMSLAEATAVLLNFHITQPPNQSHPAETPEQRRQEGIKTLASAFRYPVRPRLPVTSPGPGLPNAVREGLLQRGEVAVARLLDGLLLAGMKAREKFTEKIACGLVGVYGIGRRTVQAALNTLRYRFATSPRTPQKEHKANAAKETNKRKKTCSFVTRANRVKTLGRPAQQYRLPTNGTLYRWLGVRPSGSDRLEASALRSPAAYRQALQKALIVRRPGHYSRQWLASRLGVSIWTSRRYDAAVGITVRASYYEDRIGWSNLQRLPLRTTVSQPDGVFIAAADGRCYPPLRSIAARLLRRQQVIILKRRHWNHYRVEGENAKVCAAIDLKVRHQSISEKIHKQTDSTWDVRARPAGSTQFSVEQASSAVEAVSAGPAAPAEPERYLWVCPGCMTTHLQHEQPGPCKKCQHTAWGSVPAEIWRDVERCKTWWQERYRQFRQAQNQPQQSTPPLNARQQRLADRLYSQVQQRTPDHALTHAMARRLVREYGGVAIERALKLLGERRSLYNAAGFVITVLRGGSSSATSPAGKAANDHRAWVERLRQSPYAQFYANADQFLDTPAQQGEAGPHG